MKHKICCLVFILLTLFMSPTWAGDKGPHKGDMETDFLYNFLKGSYLLIGTQPDSNETYTGNVTVKRKGKELEVIRKITNKTIKGEGRIEYATADRRKVLRVRFVDGNQRYEATYLICSDLDNYARLTGYVYLKDGRTKVPGLEAWFIDPDATNKE